MRAAAKGQDVNSQEIASTLWALARARGAAAGASGEARQRGRCEVPGFSSQGIAGTLWALGSLEERQAKPVSRICTVASVKCWYVNSQAVAKTIWAWPRS